ncbi:MAG: formyltransferase family protein [Bacteroidota bacterium]
MIKIGILTSSGLSEFRVNSLKPILEDKECIIKVAIVDKRPKKTLKQKLKKNIKRGRGGYIVVMFFKTVFSEKKMNISIKEYSDAKGIDIIETPNPYSNETIESIKKYELDVLLLIGGYGIIKEPLLSIAPLGILSYHHGNIRKYRGMPPAFWELYNNETEMGVTVQILSVGLDCGLPVEEKVVKIERGDTLSRLQNRGYHESADMMHKAIKKVADQRVTLNQIESFGKIYTLPNLRQWIIFNLKILSRQFK